MGEQPYGGYLKKMDVINEKRWIKMKPRFQREKTVLT
jgi:hypothetical protein